MKIAIVSLIKNEARQPPIGLLRIASYIKHKIKDSSIQVRLIDNAFEDIEKEIKDFSPDIIGITTYTSYYQDSIDFAKKMKSLYPNIIVIAGGPHITTLPESTSKYLDYSVLGQGEERVLSLIQSIKDNKPFSKINGLAYWEKGKLKINKRQENKELALDDTIVDYSLLHKSYWNKRFIFEITDFQVYMGVISSIGCPFNCLFCSVKACWGNIKYRDVKKVVEEIKELHFKYKVKHIEFYDDLFALNKKRLNEFYEELKKASLLGKVTFSCFARADAFDEELCILLKRINVKSITFGFESGSDRILRFIKNNQNSSVEDNRQAILICKKHKINVSGGIVTGNPTEKIEDMKKNIEFIDFAKKHKALRVWIQILVPFPKTYIWELGIKNNKIEKNYDKIDWNSMQIHNKDNPLFLDADVPYQDFIKYYNLAKKKCQSFILPVLIKTLAKRPMNIIYFGLEFKLYLTRLVGFVRQ